MTRLTRPPSAAPVAFQPMLGLELEPTPAMLAGRQSVFQCAWCGTVVVQPRPSSASLGPCPACAQTTWWEQALPVAGLR